MPMDLSAVRALCDAAAPVMGEALWTNDVTVELRFAPLEGSTVGRSDRSSPYRRADITIDPAGHDTEADVLHTLRHELLHSVLGEFDVYANMLESYLPDAAARGVEAKAWTLACERTVNRLEHVLDGLGWTPEALAGRETTCAGCGRTWRAAAVEGTETVKCPGCGDNVTHGRCA